MSELSVYRVRPGSFKNVFAFTRRVRSPEGRVLDVLDNLVLLRITTG